MRVTAIELFEMRLELRNPFETSFGRETERHFLLVRAQSDACTGWAEVVVSEDPFYSYETITTAQAIMRSHLIPALLGRTIAHPSEALELFSRVRGHNMAKAGIENALWDIYAKEQQKPLYQVLGGVKDEIEVGISIGIQESEAALLDQVEGFLAQGYRRLKIKIKPGLDYDRLKAVRRRFGDVPMMADANSAYSLDDIEQLKKLDELQLMMIEQPLSYEDIIDHQKLRAALSTPICLDESIHSPEDARKAYAIGAADIINIKIGRLGGLTPSIATHDLSLAGGHPVWCGGMLESGIGRLFNVAITTLPGFTLPGDTAASSRYWREDIIDPEVVVSPQGRIRVPQEPGIGHLVREDRIRELAQAHAIFRA